VAGSEVNRWGIGLVQEIDSAALHVFARWQHLELNLHATDAVFNTVDQQYHPQQEFRQAFAHEF
jgi:hypothetical protein